MTRIRILTFNIHGGRSRDGQRDLGRVHALMERFDVDIGVFQEMETRPSFGGKPSDVDQLAGATRPHHFAAPSMREPPGWYGNLIVSRHKILEGRIHNLETRKKFEPRNALDIFIEAPLGKIRIVGTHLSLSPSERKTEAQKLIDLVAAIEEERKTPLFLMGDINEWQMPSKLCRFLDSKMTPVPCKATFPSKMPFLKLDRIWHDTNSLHVSAHRIDAPEIRLLSDHLPLLIEVRDLDV